MKVAERREVIDRLPFPAQVAFAARVGERALEEVRKLRPDLVAAYPALQKGVDLVWRHALHQDVDFHRDGIAFKSATSKLYPEAPDEPVPDQALRFAGQAISLGLSIAPVPKKSAKYATSAGEAMISLVGTVYADASGVEQNEGVWQDRA